MAFTFSFPTATTAASTEEDFLFHTSLIPISPTAPHRSAPCPPKQPARKNGRHIPMKEPSQCGLFTVSEIPEVPDELSYDRDMSCDESMTDADLSILQTPSLSPEPRDAQRRFSWSSDGSEERQIVTPHLGMEGEDPFASWSTIPLEDKVDDDFEMVDAPSQPSFTPFAKGISRARRAPPPLTLTTRFSLPPSTAATPTLSGFPGSATSTVADVELLTPLSSVSTTSSLMPALPIVPAEQWTTQRVHSTFQTPTTPTFPSLGRSTRKCQSPTATVDFAFAFEELLTSCGEAVTTCSLTLPVSDSDDSESLSLRIPPARDINTPEKKTKRSAAPYAPRKPSRAHPHSQLPKRREAAELSSSPLEGDHSFLTCLARSQTPDSGRSVRSARSGSSVGSAGSEKLPGRKSLPMEWRYGQMI
ncbi:hypothetical protein I350_03526 [Cryptococcus amylolentus CBS 6273]|uniref:Uncharacterized protein n=1 Tax=Cryptococcus amylolentus CBS 6273 TaxID=1296118 RepID=A0A1E3K446_9TREE|nr:hypothetical protein I350_03526 [Cryptococcus amylolentus CBS 6273]